MVFAFIGREAIDVAMNDRLRLEREFLHLACAHEVQKLPGRRKDGRSENVNGEAFGL